MGPMGDANVFWNAGKNFFLGNDLYSGIGGAGRYIYPPFAAMLFQPLGLFSMKVAAGIITFFNLVLFLMSIYLVRSIFEFFIEDKKTLNRLLLFSTLLSFRFFWCCFIYTQMNEVVLVLCLAGVLLLLKNREMPAVICFVAATFFKIIPIFFLIWLFFRGNRKTYLKEIIVSLACILIPFLLRGPATGLVDLKNYYHTFLEPFQNGRVEYPFTNQSLSAGVYKLSIPLVDTLTLGEGHENDFNILNLTEAQAKGIYQLCAILIFGAFILYLLFLKIKKMPISPIEIAVVFIATHLLSSITWDYHLVSFLYIYMVFLMLLKDSKNRFIKALQYLLLAIMVLCAILGKDTTGAYLWHTIEGFSFLTWMMVLLFFYFITISLKKKVLPI